MKAQNIVVILFLLLSINLLGVDAGKYVILGKQDIQKAYLSYLKKVNGRDLGKKEKEIGLNEYRKAISVDFYIYTNAKSESYFLKKKLDIEVSYFEDNYKVVPHHLTYYKKNRNLIVIDELISLYLMLDAYRMKYLEAHLVEKVPPKK